jgi:hypothetical protein
MVEEGKRTRTSKATQPEGLNGALKVLGAGGGGGGSPATTPNTRPHLEHLPSSDFHVEGHLLDSGDDVAAQEHHAHRDNQEAHSMDAGCDEGPHLCSNMGEKGGGDGTGEGERAS